MYCLACETKQPLRDDSTDYEFSFDE